MTIKAMAAKAGMTNSEVTSATYTIQVPPHTHSYTSSVTKEPTCTLTGTRTYTCSCGASYTETIPALGHAYDAGVITRPATVVSDGLKTFTCTRCGATKTEVIPKLDPATEEEKDIAEQIEALIEDLKDENGELKVEVDIKTEKKDDGTTETVVTVGGEEVVKIITDEDGEEKIESNIWSIGGDGVYTYTGLAIKPDVQVYDGLKKLSSGSDYSVSYKNNTNAGTKAEAKVSFKGGYKGTPAIKATFTINPADLSKDATAVSMIIAANGKDQKPIPEVILTSSGKSLGKGDLKYRYLDSKGEVVSGIKEVGDYTVEAKGKKDNGNFTGVASTTITVTGDKTKVLSNGKVKLTKKSYTYTGKPIIPEKGTYTLTLNGTELEEGTDYTLKVKNNVDPGKATMIFTASEGNEGGYVGKISEKFTISKGKELKAAGEGSDFKYIYEENVPFSKGGAKPELIVKDGDTVLAPGKDYTVNYSNNTKVTDGKDAVMTVKGKGIYKRSVTLPYGITKQDIATLSGNIIVSDKAVSKKGYRNPAVTITDLDGKKLAKDKDYALSDDYTTPDENGVVTVTLIGKGNYSGTVPVSYRYHNKNVMLDNVKASKITDKVYTGSRIKLTKKELAKLLYTGNVKSPTYLVEGKDFEVVGYSNNLKTGTAKVTLRGLGDRGGTKTVSFKIVASKKSIINVIVGVLKK